jgi:hypothetical protein
MPSHPILFTGEMVRAILAGRKTQTRRVIKPQPECNVPGSYFDAYNGGPQWNWWTHDNRVCNNRTILNCPYGAPGHTLWVKETHAFVHFDTDPESGYADNWYEPGSEDNPRDEWWSRLYRADYTGADAWPEDTEERGFRWRPSIHMPRWASRILLEVTDVRVQRVQEISYADARAEGVECPVHDFDSGFCTSPCGDLARAWVDLWESIYAQRGFGWNTNPWVWAVTFRRIEP